jgi:hypothetical protein
MNFYCAVLYFVKIKYKGAEILTVEMVANFYNFLQQLI